MLCGCPPPIHNSYEISRGPDWGWGGADDVVDDAYTQTDLVAKTDRQKLKYSFTILLLNVLYYVVNVWVSRACFCGDPIRVISAAAAAGYTGCFPISFSDFEKKYKCMSL